MLYKDEIPPSQVCDLISCGRMLSLGHLWGRLLGVGTRTVHIVVLPIPRPIIPILHHCWWHSITTRWRWQRWWTWSTWLCMGIRFQWGRHDSYTVSLFTTGVIYFVLYIMCVGVYVELFVRIPLTQTLYVTRVTKQMIIQWIATFIWLICQLDTTVLQC